MDNRFRTLIFLILTSIFILILTLTIVSFFFLSADSTPYILTIFVKYHVFFMITIAIFGLIFGSVSHILFSRDLEKNKELLTETINLLMNLLNYEEKKIINYLRDNNGVSTQYELTKISGLTKLKVHRSIDKLEKNSILKKEKLGKINKIYLSKKFRV